MAVYRADRRGWNILGEQYPAQSRDLCTNTGPGLLAGWIRGLPLTIWGDFVFFASRSPIRRVCPWPNEYRHMVMSCSLLNKELNLNFGPETINLPFLVPFPNVKLEAPCGLITVIKLVQHILQRKLGVWDPLFDPTVLVSYRVKADARGWYFLERKPWGKESEYDVKV